MNYTYTNSGASGVRSQHSIAADTLRQELRMTPQAEVYHWIRRAMGGESTQACGCSHVLGSSPKNDGSRSKSW